MLTLKSKLSWSILCKEKSFLGQVIPSEKAAFEYMERESWITEVDKKNSFRVASL